jgi:Ran-binding protein 9/10
VYLPHKIHDIFAAVGMEGRNELEVNLGGAPLKWKEGNQWEWRFQGHAERLGQHSGNTDEPPAYSKHL